MLNDLYTLLAGPDFRHPGSGLMSFPAYVYTYPPDREYAFRDALPHLASRLKRPHAGIEPLLSSIYDGFLDFLEARTLGGRSILSRILEMEPEQPERMDSQLKEHAQSKEFARFMADRFAQFIRGDSTLDRPYVFSHGWGSIYPYLRASKFLERMEPHVRGYKLIVFYPGTYDAGTFRLFGQMESSHVYRANCLNVTVGS